MKTINSGILYIVSTPIGNLEDITLRALRILKEVNFIAVEDTRHSQKLLNHYNISKPLISYWSEKEKIRSGQIIEKLLTGQSGALICDAGTPGISDPGAVLIKRAIEENIPVVPIPGPSGIITALSVSGLPTNEFIFLGFLPPKSVERQKKLKELIFEARTMIFYEAPHRILETLKDMLMVLGNRNAVIAKEITKLYEEFIRGSLSELIEKIENTKILGEFIILIGGNKTENISIDEALEEIKLLMKKGMGRKEAVRKVSEDYGFSKKELYDKSIGTGSY